MPVSVGKKDVMISVRSYFSVPSDADITKVSNIVAIYGAKKATNSDTMYVLDQRKKYAAFHVLRSIQDAFLREGIKMRMINIHRVIQHIKNDGTFAPIATSTKWSGKDAEVPAK